MMDFSTKQVMMRGENGPHGRVPRKSGGFA